MHSSLSDKTATISQNYGLLMARMNSDNDKPNAATSPHATPAPDNLIVAAIRNASAPFTATETAIFRTCKETMPPPDNLIVAAIRKVSAPFTATETPTFRTRKETTAAEAVPPIIEGTSTRKPRRELNFSRSGRSHNPIASEAMAAERRQMIKDGSYTNALERELIKKYIPDNTDIATLNELGLPAKSSK
ncbi:hypothetical protein I6H07_13270 [Hafnia alvei]|uniref:hypothetical protein n=1 Tax=Hafnia alvei TaxID=569 RepID=UPI000B68B5F9|nr:hypothetical protein [Hafnia alvei]MBI0276746.1 hypothetical protein [Hafnia alvei]PNK99795.1 hypothetical protein CEQ28_020495 [Hafnia alvei]